jgi:hypothetical protein
VHSGINGYPAANLDFDHEPRSNPTVSNVPQGDGKDSTCKVDFGSRESARRIAGAIPPQQLRLTFTTKGDEV